LNYTNIDMGIIHSIILDIYLGINDFRYEVLMYWSFYTL